MNSNFKNEIIEFLRSIYKKQEIILANDIPYEVRADVYIPGINIAIIFHSISNYEQKEQFNHVTPAIKTVHLSEDQWLFHEEKIRSKIKSLLGTTKRIHGRETNLVNINNNELMEFLKENHLNVPIKAKFKYGLLKDKELVAVMSFSKGRNIEREMATFHSFELLRFCNKLDTTVVGGFSKLLQHFIKMQNPDDVMTYVDGDWSDAQSFLALGFEISEKMPAIEFWLNAKTGEREYPHLVLKEHDLSVSEIENEMDKTSFMEKFSYKKVYNSGSYKLIQRRK